MFKNIIILLLAIMIITIHCSSSSYLLPRPVENKNLLIGSLTLDINGYQDRYTVIQENIEVAIVGQYVEDGILRNFGKWTTTDENGYFYIANVPQGEYAIKGFRIYLIGIGDLNIMNQLNDPTRNYYEILQEDIISLSGDLFDTKSDQQVVNMKHHLFVLYANELIDHQQYDRIKNLKLSNGDFLTEPPVPVYFIENYENSGWEKYLSFQVR